MMQEQWMTITSKANVLTRLFDLYDETVASFDTACVRGCSTCCTCNVTCTTLEGWLLIDHLMVSGAWNAIDAMVSRAPAKRFQPTVTINQMVALCVRGEALPEESNDPGAGACAWLEGQACPVYAVRPFACRAMLSTASCHGGGQACMPPFILSLNNVMMQYLEALDRPGASGNVADILAFLAEERCRRAYLSQTWREVEPPLLPNHGFSVLMIPPEHRGPLQPVVRQIQAICSSVL
jgi:Fe-S-cluster containining protein